MLGDVSSHPDHVHTSVQHNGLGHSDGRWQSTLSSCIIVGMLFGAVCVTHVRISPTQVWAKQAGSERQRADVLQMLRCFSAAVAEQVRADPRKNTVHALNDVIARYNGSTTARNTAVEGNEKMAMQFLVTQSDEFCNLLEGIWRTYKVRESPMNAQALAKPWLRCEGRFATHCIQCKHVAHIMQCLQPPMCNNTSGLYRQVAHQGSVMLRIRCGTDT